MNTEVESINIMTDTGQAADATDETVSALGAPDAAGPQFVRWFREVAPYVHAFRNKTFVVAFGGELVQADALNTLVQDLSLLKRLRRYRLPVFP